MSCEAVLKESKLTEDDIKSVFLVGGSTRMPVIQKTVHKVFNKEPIASVNVDEVVALGASLYAAYKSDQSELNPVQKTALATLSIGESATQYFGTTVLSSEESSFGHLENSILISKGQKIPCSVTKTYYTVVEGQETLKCDVTESGRKEKDPDYVNIIWEGDLKLPSGRPSGQKIDVTFRYTDNQIMTCTFIDVDTGDKKEIDLSMDTEAKVDSDIDEFLVE